MAGKFKSIVMFVAVVSIFCFALNIAGTTSPLYACDACTSKTKQCPLGTKAVSLHAAKIKVHVIRVEANVFLLC
jgi:hypothetical protein